MTDFGRTAQEAIYESCQQRLRPILLTTATTMGGMLPLWLSHDPMFETMAVSIIFGLAFGHSPHSGLRAPSCTRSCSASASCTSATSRSRAPGPAEALDRGDPRRVETAPSRRRAPDAPASSRTDPGYGSTRCHPSDRWPGGRPDPCGIPRRRSDRRHEREPPGRSPRCRCPFPPVPCARPGASRTRTPSATPPPGAGRTLALETGVRPVRSNSLSP